MLYGEPISNHEETRICCEEEVAMKVTLLVRAPKKPEKRVVVERDVVIGRGKDCNLQVLSNDVSRHHCRLVIGESEVAVRDLGSGNGTFINSQNTDPNVDTPLISGDIVRIGPLVIKVEFEVTSQPVAAEPAESTPAIFSPPIEAASSHEEPAFDGVLDPVESSPGAQPFLEPVTEHELLPDDDLMADEPEESDAAVLTADDAATETSAPTEPTPGKLKSLFGMFGKKKDKAPVATVATVGEESDVESDPAESEQLLLAGNADYDEETVVFDQQNAFTPDEEEMELQTDDDEGLSDEEDYLDDEIEEEETVDPGFADFLSNVDQPPT